MLCIYDTAEDAVRTLVDIPEPQIEALGAICTRKKLPRSEAIRQAIAAYIAVNRAAPEEAYGLWRGRGTDGLDYQEELRAEW